MYRDGLCSVDDRDFLNSEKQNIKLKQIYFSARELSAKQQLASDSLSIANCGADASRIFSLLCSRGLSFLTINQSIYVLTTVVNLFL